MQNKRNKQKIYLNLSKKNKIIIITFCYQLFCWGIGVPSWEDNTTMLCCSKERCYFTE